jgi:hypothetical protein
MCMCRLTLIRRPCCRRQTVPLPGQRKVIDETFRQTRQMVMTSC